MVAVFRVASFGPMERVVRPFVAPRVLALYRIPPEPAPEPGADIVHARWGAEGSQGFSGDRDGNGFHVKPPKEEDDPAPGAIIVFQEVGTREVVRVRVENPDNAAQWVEFDDPLTVTFRPPPELKRPLDEFWQLVFIDQSQA